MRLGKGRRNSQLSIPLRKIPATQIPEYLPALSTTLPVLMPCHEDTSTTSWCWALPSETLDAALGVDLVVLEDGHLDLLPLVLDLLWGGL